MRIYSVGDYYANAAAVPAKSLLDSDKTIQFFLN